MFYGFMGAHRTGKTTLAREVAKELQLPFVETKVSSTIKQLGANAQDDMPFPERMELQERVLLGLLECYDQAAGEHPNSIIVVDRTPLDVLAYTQSEVLRQSINTIDLHERMSRHEDLCWATFNEFFVGATLVRPGIPLAHDPDKAPAEYFYQAHVASLALALALDPSRDIPLHILHRDNLELHSRITDAVRAARNIMTERETETENTHAIH